MPRTARIKDKNRPQHLISRSIPELNLFRVKEDKDDYLNLMKKASRVYRITIIAYCLMDNHVHILVHPNGGDISEFMKNINNTYAKKYNRRYGRSGHLYRDRFKNIIIKDEVQLLRTSTYIHNNPKDLLVRYGYKSVSDYPYSSLKDYLNPSKGSGVADPRLIFEFMSGEGVDVGNHYRVLMDTQCQTDDQFEKELEEAMTKGTYRSKKVPVSRNVSTKKVLSVLSKILEQEEINLTISKYQTNSMVYKSLAAICLRIFGDMTTRDLAKIFKGYSFSSISHLCSRGYYLLEQEKLYPRIAKALQ